MTRQPAYLRPAHAVERRYLLPAINVRRLLYALGGVVVVLGMVSR